MSDESEAHLQLRIASLTTKTKEQQDRIHALESKICLRQLGDGTTPCSVQIAAAREIETQRKCIEGLQAEIAAASAARDALTRRIELLEADQ